MTGPETEGALPDDGEAADWLGETGWRPWARGLRTLATTLLRAVRPSLSTLVAYGLSTAAFSYASLGGGLLTPDASPDPLVVGCGLLALSLRLTVLWVALPMAAGRVVAALVGLTPASTTPPRPPR